MISTWEVTFKSGEKSVVFAHDWMVTDDAKYLHFYWRPCDVAIECKHNIPVVIFERGLIDSAKGGVDGMHPYKAEE